MCHELTQLTCQLMYAWKLTRHAYFIGMLASVAYVQRVLQRSLSSRQLFAYHHDNKLLLTSAYESSHEHAAKELLF